MAEPLLALNRRERSTSTSTSYGTSSSSLVSPNPNPNAVDNEYEPNKLTTLNGVYVPCLLNIMGVVMFLRLSWAVGEAGWAGILIMLSIAQIQAILTVLSVSAIASNGKMQGGGSYFIMSRSLGPQLGGAMGCLFYTAFSLSAAFYAIGFGTEVIGTWFPDHVDEKWPLCFVSSLALFFVLCIAYVGANAFTKINVWLFLLQFGATWVGLCSIWFGPSKNLRDHTRFDGLSTENLRQNAWADYSTESSLCDGVCTSSRVYGIIFPAATGIMEGANLSGDLANPAASIGVGTLSAVFTAIIHYITMIFTFGAGYDRTSLQANPLAWQDTTVEPYILVVGVIVSSLSSALGAVFGGSRILQALGTDRILPGLHIFAKGTKKGNEPRRAVFFTWFIAQCCLFIGSLDAVAPLISAIFCLSYGMTNLACFLLKISGTPNFRPRFRYWSWHTALLGFIVSIGNMFYLNVWFASCSLACFIALVIYLFSHAPDTAWGDVRQALLFHQVRKFLLYLDPRKQRGKLWRPSILLLPSSLSSPLIRFCNILKKGGLYVVGHVIVGDFVANRWLETKQHLMDTIDQMHIKAFSDVTMSTSLYDGIINLISMSGIGGMSPNTIVLPLINTKLQPIPALETACTYIKLQYTILDMKKELLLAANFDRYNDFQAKNIVENHRSSWTMLQRTSYGTVDVWITSTNCTNSWHEFRNTPLFTVQLSHVLSRNRLIHLLIGIRIFRVVGTKYASSNVLKSEEEFIANLLDESRIEYESVNTIVFNEDQNVLLHEEKSREESILINDNKDDDDDDDNDDDDKHDDDDEEDEEGINHTHALLQNKRLSTFTINSLDQTNVEYRRIKQQSVGLGVEMKTSDDFKLLNKLIKQYSNDSHVILIEKPPLPTFEQHEDREKKSLEYIENMQSLADGLPPLLLAQASIPNDNATSFFTRDI